MTDYSSEAFIDVAFTLNGEAITEKVTPHVPRVHEGVRLGSKFYVVTNVHWTWDDDSNEPSAEVHLA